MTQLETALKILSDLDAYWSEDFDYNREVECEMPLGIMWKRVREAINA